MIHQTKFDSYHFFIITFAKTKKAPLVGLGLGDYMGWGARWCLDCRSAVSAWFQKATAVKSFKRGP
jgi:hypothetical protein